ncbi:MAG: non-heme iron oxygenase ferredoxin subunit [Actinomycetota bacterium]
MTAYTLFGLERLEPEAALKVSIEGREIALVRIDDDVYAIGDTCSHQDVSLSEGFVESDDCAIECPKHGALFDLRTGDALSLPATKPIPTYDVAVVDGDVVLTLAPIEEDA